MRFGCVIDELIFGWIVEQMRICSAISINICVFFLDLIFYGYVFHFSLFVELPERSYLRSLMCCFFFFLCHEIGRKSAFVPN